MYDVVLSGYYGFGNSGDEALLKTIISDLKRVKPGISIAVLSNDPEFTKKTYGVHSVHRMKLGEIRKVLKNAGLLISGGGSLVQDATSSKSLFYYLGIIKLAKICGVRVMLYANGVGPVRKRLNRKLTGMILNRADVITLREPDSRDELLGMSVTIPEIVVTADPALGLGKGPDGVSIKNELFGDKKVIAVSLRSWKNTDDNTVLAVSDFVKEFEKDGYAVFLLPMQYSKDMDICQRISDKTGCFVLPDEYTVEQIMGLLSCCDAVVGMRLHSVIYAAAAGTGCVGIVYDPKVRSFMKYMGMDSCIDIDKLTSNELVECTRKAINAGPFDTEGFKKLAFSNAEIAVKLLEQGKSGICKNEG